MRTATMLVCVLGGLLGCDKDKPQLEWGPRKIKEVRMGPLAVTIPAGMRDASELANATRRSEVPAGERWLTLEQHGDAKGLSSIRFSHTTSDGEVSCAEIEEQAKRAGHRAVETSPITAGEHPGCKVRFVTTESTQRGVFVFAGRDWYQVLCLGDNNPAFDRGCDDVLAQLKIDYTPPPRDADRRGHAIVKAHERARSCGGKAGAKVVLAIDVAADGTPTVAVREASEPALGECVAAAMRKAEFPPHAMSFDDTMEW